MHTGSPPLAVTILSGFLGGGKTTLVNRILAEPHGRAIAVIVNDMSEINIDAELIRRAPGGLTRTEETLVEMTNGCICCTLRDDLRTEVRRLAERGTFDYLVVESSGISEPLPVATAFDFDDPDHGRLSEVARLDTMVTVVDATTVEAEFHGRETVADRGMAQGEDDVRPLCGLLTDQIELADVILLNKVTDAGPHRVAAARRIIAALNPSARLLEADHCTVPVEEIVDTRRFDFIRARQRPRWFAEMQGRGEHRPESETYGIGSFTYRARRPFDLEKVRRVLLSPWPNVLRAKGHFWVASQPDWAMGYSLAGSMVGIDPIGRWWAATAREKWPTHPGSLGVIHSHWARPYGDRRQELVFIGTGIDRAAIAAALDACLVGEAWRPSRAAGSGTGRRPAPAAGTAPAKRPGR